MYLHRCMQIASRHLKTYEGMENPNAQKTKNNHTINKLKRISIGLYPFLGGAPLSLTWCNPSEDSRQHENKTLNKKVLMVPSGQIGRLDLHESGTI